MISKINEAIKQNDFQKVKTLVEAINEEVNNVLRSIPMYDLIFIPFIAQGYI